MNFQEAETAYSILRGDLERGAITAEAFVEAVGRLQLEDPAGVWWQIRSVDGAWLAWNGTEWVEKKRPVMETGPASAGVSVDQKIAGLETEEALPPGFPRTLPELARLLLERFLKQLPRKLVIMAVLFGAVWILHTYLLVVKNNGFYKITKPYLGMILALKGGILGGTLFWTLCSGLIFSLIARVQQKGLPGLQTDLAGTAPFLSAAYRRSGAAALPLLLGGAAVGLRLSFLLASRTSHFIANRATTLLLALALLLVLSQGTHSFLFLVARLAWSDCRRLFNMPVAKPFPTSPAVVSGAGLTAGLALMVILPFLPQTGSIAFWVLAVLAVIMAFKGKGESGLTAAIMVLVFGGTMILLARTGLAHDGGWEEYGCSLGRWIAGEGSTQAVIHGLLPALGAVIGAIFPGLIESLGIVPVAEGFVEIPWEPEIKTEPEPSEFSGWDWPDFGQSLGLPGENPFTNFQSGAGPGDCVRQGLPRYFINTASLNLVVQDTIFTGNGLGPGIDLTLTYNSTSSAGTIFGPGWSFTYDWLVEQKGNRVNIHKGSGQVLNFTAAGEGSSKQPAEARAPLGILHRLLDYGTYWLYIEKGSPIYYYFDRVPSLNLGRLTAISDYYGNEVTLAYSKEGNLETVTDAAGRAIRFTFDQQHRCTAFLLPDGRRATFGYNQAGLLIHTEDLMGIPVDYEYDSRRTLIKMITGKSRRTVSFSYRLAGKEKLLASFSDPNGNLTHYNLLPGSPRKVEITDPEGNKAIFESQAGLTTKVVNGLGQEVSFEYERGLPVSYRDRNGGLTRWEYDSAGQTSKEIDPAGQAVSFNYDERGNLTGITDPLGGSWRYYYNEQNSLLEIRSPAGRKIALDYNDRGLPVSITAFDGQKTTHDYDQYGNIIAAHHSGGGSSFSAYDEFGYRIASTTDELGYTALLEQDGNGRLIKFRHPDGAEKTLIHDCCYALLATDERGISRGYERDANGNIVKEINAATASAEHGYNGNNNLISYKDFAGETTYYHYDGARRLVSITNALGQHQQFGYDAAGNMTGLWVAGEEKMRFQYDPCHRLIATSDPLGATVTVERDTLGREVIRRGARGREISFVRDADGLLEKVLHDGQEVGSYRYNGGGQMVEARDGLGSVSFDYDEKGLPRRISYPGGWELLGASNAAGLLESITYPGGLKVEYRYNNRLLPVEINWQCGGIKYEYDPAGNLLREERSNGTVSRYEYDENERLIFLEHRRGEETFIERRNKLNAAGAITEATGFQPLEPPADHDFNLFCNSADQISAPSFAYDGDGNLVSGPGWEAAYDPENHLVEFKMGDHGCSYRYNSLGQRVEKEVCGQVHRYYHDMLGNVMFEIEAGGEEPRCYLYCHGRPVAVIDEKKQVRFYHYDQNGNTLALTGGDGEVLAAYAYSPFGCSLSIGDPGGNPFTFCGAYGVTEEAAGLYAMGRRFYRATWGRFLQKDPMGIAGGINPYAYAANNPVTFIDPDGLLVLEAWVTWKAVGAVVGVVTVSVAAAKTAYSGYNAWQEKKKRDQAIENVQKAYDKYHETVLTQGTSPQEREEAYKRYEEAWNQMAGYHNGACDNGQKTVTNAIDTGINTVTPDCLNPIGLVINTSVGDREPLNPCTGGGGNYYLGKKGRLPFQ